MHENPRTVGPAPDRGPATVLAPRFRRGATSKWGSTYVASRVVAVCLDLLVRQVKNG